MNPEIVSLLTVALKAVAVYLFILFAIRLFGKKELAQLSVIDLTFLLLISNAVQNAMVGSDNSLTGGMAAATGLFITNYIFKQLNYRFPIFGKVVQGEAIMLVYEGKIMTENLKKATITEGELEAAAREHGVASVKEVTLAILEVDGNISVVSDSFQTKTQRKRKTHKSLLKEN